MRRMTPDYRTIAAFRHDNPEAIIRTGAAFISFCRENGLVTPGKVALDGTKMRAVASAKNIAGADRQIGRRWCGERVCKYVEISVVDVSLKKKEMHHCKPK